MYKLKIINNIDKDKQIKILNIWNEENIRK